MNIVTLKIKLFLLDKNCILFVIVCLIIYGLFSILLLGIGTQLRIVSFFKVKEIGKKIKHPERGDWDINGGRVIEFLLFKGIDIYSGEGVI